MTEDCFDPTSDFRLLSSALCPPSAALRSPIFDLPLPVSAPVITVENLGKRYIIGHQRSKDDGLRHVIEEAMRAPLQWLRSRREQKQEQKEEFWALKDVSFEVKQGEVVGIIGRNGAGKSTLLKILSRITEPTAGRIRIKGRVASLLEVGTGFHQELTGRENIFLNGAILGMTKAEIKRKFDEIIAFSEIEKFLDTPVKRYSSGMYVRLAFAVAAHLEPEILVIDEVLAVGDLQFQQKCLGKMDEVAKGGRTILFVSHNMAAVRSLCSRCILLNSGGVFYDGEVERAIDLNTDSCRNSISTDTNIINGDPQRGEDINLLFSDAPRHMRVHCGSPVKLDFAVQFPHALRNLNVAFTLLSLEDTPIMSMDSGVQAVACAAGCADRWRVRVDLGAIPLNAGVYRVRIYISSGGFEVARFTDAIVMEVLENDVFGSGNALPSAVHWGPTYWAPTWLFEPEDNYAGTVRNFRENA